MSKKSDFGLIGLAVMGQNLVLNVESRGFQVSVYNRTTSVTDEFLAKHPGKQLVGAHTLEEFVLSLATPRKIHIMVKSTAVVDSDRDAVDAVIEQLIPLLDKDDIIIDGGNSFYKTTERRDVYLAAKGLRFIGAGVSGGEEGARKGPSIMPGGPASTWEVMKPIFESIAAKVDGEPCVIHIGPGGAGHYVKMVHNGIEYGDMQLICEAYLLLKEAAGLSNDELYDVFADWNRGELQSYLIEITRDIFSVKDDQGGEGYLVDKILDVAGAKGTGKWMSQLALDLGVPSTLVTTAVYARGLAAMKEARVRASKVLPAPSAAHNGPFATAVSAMVSDRKKFVEAVRQALYASKICSYAQGFVQLQEASREHKWDLNYGDCALLWRGGCIIRAQFLDHIKEAFDGNPNLENLLLHPYFKQAIEKSQEAWRAVVMAASHLGLPVPAFTTALAYYDSYRLARLPSNLLQAQRDYFGAHTYQRVDRDGVFHSEWLDLRKKPS
jgi:6-phosphogluconate dehydrogenase